MKIGRNEPCPCGSGKKFKRCCMLVENPATAISDELKEMLGNANVNSLEEAQELASQLMQQKNNQPHDDFLGLTPDQMNKVLHHPFEPSPAFTLPKTLALEPEAPILYLIKGIASAIDENGLKATATGKLPPILCKALFEGYKTDVAEVDFSLFLKVHKEDDFYYLQVARIVMDLSGLLRKTKGRFFLTKKYHKVMTTTGNAGLYPILFEGFCTKFNWAYGDGYEEIPFIQHSFLFSMYMLHKFGNTQQPLTFYEAKFLQAFPMVVDQVESDSSYSTEEEEVQHCFSIRVLDRFCWFMGLASIKSAETENESRGNRLKNRVIEKLPLLDAVVWFHFSAKEMPTKSVH